MSNSSQMVDFEMLLDYLKHSHGFDFTGYKQSSLMRRILKRIQAVHCESFSHYRDFLEVHPEEFALLFNTILINVSGFFRDQKAWESIDINILPRILNSKKDHQPVRVWSAGCASGEEAYTISILLAEKLGIDRFREEVKIYATDLDEESLAKARSASYTEQELAALPPQYLEKYFDHSGNRYVFNKDLRRSVIFGRHDLIQDAPISRIDLLICRNILMYFNAETQSKILARLSYSLAERGFLFLGKAEMLLTHANLFTPVDLKNRIFSKAPSINIRDRLLVMSQNGSDEVNNHLIGHIRLRDAAFDSTTVAQVIVDTNGHVILTNERARLLFGISQRDIGRPFQDLELSYRPVELRSSIDAALARNTPIILKDVEMMVGGADSIYLNIQIIPLFINGAVPGGVSISFVDVSEHKHLQMQLQQANQELETAMEELQSTNEELETTNEELQSTIEELETTNEELQSTNEELETMNEELQSTNEELETMNDEMTQRSDELNQVNSFLESILTSMRGGVVVIDTDMSVQIWSRKAEDLWGLRSDEVKGHNFLALDIGLPVNELKKPVQSILIGERDFVEVTLDALNRRGRSIVCVVTCTPLTMNKAIKGAILVINQKDGTGE